MALTSEQYKYLLLKKLQRHFSLTSVEDRNYTYTFFNKLFDNSVTITEDSFNRFVEIMDDELVYCAGNGIYACKDITSTMINEHGVVLINAFSAIGIDLKIEEVYNGDSKVGGDATFTKPNGEVMVYEVRGTLMATKNYFYIYSKSQTEYQYAKLSAPYYNLENMDLLELSDIESNLCGLGCYWSFDVETATMTISGDGIYYPPTTDEQLGSGIYKTLILGANVSQLTAESLAVSDIETIVLLHASDFPLVLDKVIDSKTAYTWEVYTDNLAFKNYAWSSNVAITWHSLDEWEG